MAVLRPLALPSHTLGPVTRITVLWHGQKRIGICVFCAPAAELRLRNEFFGVRRVRRRFDQRTWYQRLNRELWLLSRLVLHPTYRGAGIAAEFVRHSCRTCPVAWIECLSTLGHFNPVFEHAGFRRIGVVRKRHRRLTPAGHARIYGQRLRLGEETLRKSLTAEPVYYVFDNRRGLL